VPSVFIVDRDVALRELLGSVIREAGWRPEAFASFHEFQSRHRAVAPCCLILDASSDGLEPQHDVTVDEAEMPIIVTTRSCDMPATVRAMKAGAADVVALTTPFAADALVRAIQQAIEGSNAVVSQEAEVRGLRRSYASLSSREREVMALVVSGRPNKRVARELGISEVTVKAHRGKVMRKMNADSLPHLVNMAASLRLAAAPRHQSAADPTGHRASASSLDDSASESCPAPSMTPCERGPLNPGDGRSVVTGVNDDVDFTSPSGTEVEPHERAVMEATGGGASWSRRESV
jgi:FixJ family two-component response regulator